MSIYLVDYENVNADGLNGIEDLSENDSVYVFYTANSGNLSFDMHKKLVESKAEIKYFSVVAGKNALDFQLTMFAGYLIGKGINQNIYIISNDKGFDAGNAFYDSYLLCEGIDVVRNTSISATYITKETPSKNKIVKSDSVSSDSLYNSLCALLPEYSSCDVINISAVLLGTPGKQKFYTGLVELFKQEKGSKIYTALKSHYDELKKFDTNSGTAVVNKNQKINCQKLNSLLKKVSADEKKKVREALESSNDKGAFYRRLVSVFGQKRGLEIYNMLKKQYEDIRKTA